MDTVHISGNIAVNAREAFLAKSAGASSVLAYNHRSKFEWSGSFVELEQFPIEQGEHGPFYFIRQI